MQVSIRKTLHLKCTFSCAVDDCNEYWSTCVIYWHRRKWEPLYLVLFGNTGSFSVFFLSEALELPAVFIITWEILWIPQCVLAQAFLKQDSDEYAGWISSLLHWCSAAGPAGLGWPWWLSYWGQQWILNPLVSCAWQVRGVLAWPKSPLWFCCVCLLQWKV